ncbi:MAG TPA: hypothetical protein VE844_10275 [Gammaproteobacteria bacterium]|jgi:hypothetical protein|nr:hypothetical protein [Gammaproteobacteria bacterium]
MEVDIQDDQVILTEVKVTLVMSKSAFIDCLRKGKQWRQNLSPSSLSGRLLGVLVNEGNAYWPRLLKRVVATMMTRLHVGMK